MSKRSLLIVGLLAVLGGSAVLLFHVYVRSGWSDDITEKDLIKASKQLQSGAPSPPTAPVSIPLSRSIRLAVGSLGLATDSQNLELADLLTAELSAARGLELVDRASLDKVLREMEMNLSGLVRAK